ncbi:ribosomal-protein-alanine N-acetyltransferase [Roseiarcus fermentans]|uniref:Ribosomal-protein-alanine N-acetyltransferase n=1 Tax=Roseiarcus fermentans TaxID=1473586 RepID=A0A366EJV8_9HYPH|nr:ribosomal protein S18-alanine N-acetyltransferase [Roseiarcus fermentans]RBP02681.1 ribosomal-protein-alanine N-acetyltransferase [Roseiarcus fermentans]
MIFGFWWRPFPIFGFWWGPSPPVIRRLRSDKAEACAALHAEGFAHPWSEEEVARLIADPSTISMAALDPIYGTVRGFAIVRLAADESEVLTIAVAASWRGWGIGRAILSDVLRQAADAGARAMFLEVAEDNAAALTLYRRLGFVQVGERPGYYRRKDGSRALALVMRRGLP